MTVSGTSVRDWVVQFRNFPERALVVQRSPNFPRGRRDG